MKTHGRRPSIVAITVFLTLILSGWAVSPISSQRQPIPASLPPPKFGAASDLAVAHVADRVLVRVGDVDALPTMGVSHLFGDWYRVGVAPGETTEQAMQRLAALPAVQVVELEYQISVDPIAADSPSPPPGHDVAALAVPDDPMFGQQWNLPMVQAATAWDSATGEGVIVAVIDSGVSKGSDLACHTFVDEYNAILDASGPRCRGR